MIFRRRVPNSVEPMRSDDVEAEAEVVSPVVSTAAGGMGPPAASGVGLALQHAQLVRDCLAGVPGAWDEFVGRFAGLLAHVVDRTAAHGRIPLGPSDRDDLVAEILLELLRNDAQPLRSFAGRASLPTYLTVIGRRVAWRGLERLRAQGRTSGSEAPQPVDAHDALAALADREAVESLLSMLDATEARLVRLHHLEARSYGEISRLTGLPVGSIGPALSRARQKLRDQGAAAGAAMTTAGSARSTGS